MTILNIPHDEFEQAVDRWIEWESAWNGALPSDVFFDVWAALEQSPPLEVEARLVDGELILSAPSDSPITVQKNRIRLQNGQELIVKWAA